MNYYLNLIVGTVILQIDEMLLIFLDVSIGQQSEYIIFNTCVVKTHTHILTHTHKLMTIIKY